MFFSPKALGLQPSPFDTWLTSRGAKTEALRMERHNANALTLVTRLEAHKRVKSVRYSFLASHPQHALAKKQMTGGSGMSLADFGHSQAGALAFIRFSVGIAQVDDLWADIERALAAG
jgi:cystathionine beta-lyase/cystathionine gamma-synthase